MWAIINDKGTIVSGLDVMPSVAQRIADGVRDEYGDETVAAVQE